MTLSYDYARCASRDGCTHAPTCKRTEPGKHAQAFPGGDDCYGYIPKPQEGE